MFPSRICSASFVSVALGVALAGIISANVNAQAPSLTAKPLLRTTLSGDDTKEAVILAVDFPPGATTGRHTHLGDEYAVVLQGTLELSAEGRETRRVSAGDAYHNPRGLIHETRNVGETPARIVSTFVIDKGKAITQPVDK